MEGSAALWSIGGPPSRAHRRERHRLHIAAIGLVFATLLLSGCQKQEQAEAPLLRVRAQTVAYADFAPTFSLTGVVAARTVDNLAFRVGGRVAERMADVGQHVGKDTVLARLDPQTQQSDLVSAKANLDAAQAQLRQSSATFDRQKTLLAQGFTTRRDYDQANQGLRTAEASVQAAQSQLAVAQENLSYTELKAGAAGIITARDVEAGQVVQAAQTVFTLAEDGDRDAVFNVQETLVATTPASPAVTITLLSDPKVTAQGSVREVSPVIDTSTATVRVKVAIPGTPAAMPLGAAVAGSIRAAPRKAVVLPWQALSASDGKPAVWLIDPETRRVSLAPVQIYTYDSHIVVIDRGLEDGQIAVTAGGQMLHPGQQVEIAEGGQ
ncbi:RND family efflux transporter MFP subunit [Pseudaminobacter salicylatoxidans]|uniref:RND family efflux transporter MFP subunit n=1 Tax=Pseudaminobacter salicylatoxidans TaxID=93369 RepID=A0A316BVZ9_PSESE|nr:efflux RND transporter periplasmic adaptor subunit [Pseudaminobacter salicylatoxidans]PWJ78407.1 RND family efflux transporter MFP subunit [Pseudaminobacter salicylatoxidans]